MNKIKIKKFDYYEEARQIDINDTLGRRTWNSCVHEAIENKLNEVIKKLNNYEH